MTDSAEQAAALAEEALQEFWRSQSAPAGVTDSAEQTAALAGEALQDRDRPRVESPRFVNQIDYVEHLAKKNGLNLVDTTELVLSAITKKNDAPPGIDVRAFAVEQARILRSKGVDTPEKLCAMLRQAKKFDLITSGFHGLAGSAGFNGMSAYLNFMGGDVISQWIGMSDKPTVGEMATLGAIAGMPLAVSDVVVDPAVDKTFHDAYYTHPPDDKLPAWVNEARASNTLTTAQLGHMLGVLFVEMYGGRNLLRFATTGLAAASGATTKVVGIIDDYFDPIGGCFSGMGFRILRNVIDEKRGAAGVPYLLARTDLGDCIDHLNSSNAAKAAGMGIRAAEHLGNSVTQLPEGLLKSVTTLEGIASLMVLIAGFGGVFAIKTVASAATNENLVAKEGAKYTALAVLYYSYGQGIAIARRHNLNPNNILGKKVSEGIDIGMQYMADRLGMVLRRRNNAAHANHGDGSDVEDGDTV